MSCSRYLLLFQFPKWMFTAAVGIVAFLFGHFVTPYCKGFYWNDASINMPFVDAEEFPTWSLVPIVVLPIALYAIVVRFMPRDVALFGRESASRLSMWLEINQWALIQCQALMFQLMFVETTKLFAGRLRPDFLDRLRQAGISPPANLNDLQYNCETISMSDVLRDGRLSFPSGHSSTSFGAMVPLCFFVAFHLRPIYHSCVYRLVLTLLPLALAFIVAVSRTRDNRHHFADIVAGSIIGGVAAYLAVIVNLRYNERKGLFEKRGVEDEATALIVNGGENV